ncbi:TetR family transcriptional regulator [Elizabethkingia argentiflava]|uniref:TetR family transcriptional regulator n=1 Tax=Elizabethkingia argenteiflava TaxID=2681556 RepID=A0A845PW46_9FLAO|nr:TetR/AcrR family transcriptional regulator [Elizabethkingia argenteiflava]NAW50330.1 TetR family transcriptional regulator [Elizabethkingia argenteiflava]
MTKAERTRQFIVKKTAAIFNEKGYAGTSLSDLINVTGLSKGCIYGNFKNKDEIALAAFDFNKDRLSAYFENKISKIENSVERLLVYPKVLRNFLIIPIWKGGCPILNTSTEADDTHPLLKKKAASALSSWQDRIAVEIKRGIERKEIKADTHAMEVAVVMVLLIESAVMQTKVSESTSELNIAMGFLEKLIRNLEA